MRSSCPIPSPCLFVTKSPPKYAIWGLIKSYNLGLSDNTTCELIGWELRVQEPSQSFQGDISFPPSLCHQIYINQFMCGLHRKAFSMAFQRQHSQETWLKTGGSGRHQALGLPGTHLPFLLFYDGDYVWWGATRLDRKPLFKAFCQYFFQGDWICVWTLRLGQVLCSSSPLLLNSSSGCRRIGSSPIGSLAILLYYYDTCCI